MKYSAGKKHRLPRDVEKSKTKSSSKDTSEKQKKRIGRGFCRITIVLIVTLLIYYNFLNGMFFNINIESDQLNSLNLLLSSFTSEKVQAVTYIQNSFNSENNTKNNDISASIKTNRTSEYAISLPKAGTSRVRVQQMLANHPFHRLNETQSTEFALEDYLSFLKQQPECADKPVFTSMANVFSDSYWQMIENFIYTMAKFELISCTVMVCVSDPKCMRLCADSDFPCYDFQYSAFHPNSPLPSALEQIGELKLLHLPKALKRGVDLLMLDLDVGFLDSPMRVMEGLKLHKADIFLQKDITFIMNRTVAGWRTWYTAPMPNIGLFLCKGNEKTVRMFDIAWKEYSAITKQIKHNPGKDQNKVVNAMYIARSAFGLQWSYIPPKSAVLLDKIYKFEGKTYELGGEAAVAMLSAKGAHAVHTTCYEQKTKVNGLKAANAFWNPVYYDPDRRTITKPLLWLTETQLRHEVRALLYLGVATNRSVIMPNVLGDELLGDVDLYKGMALWPGFRIAYYKEGMFRLDTLEPAFYWRVQRDYSDGLPDRVPPPTVVTVHSSDVREIEAVLMSEKFRDCSRIVLNIQKPIASAQSSANSAALSLVTDEVRLVAWAADSVGRFDSYEVESNRYTPLHKLNFEAKGKAVLRLPEVADQIVHEVRLCAHILGGDRGNRSCFDKCD